nr:MAG TPA: hypothetical protein [Bacteriophage sp.]
MSVIMSFWICNMYIIIFNLIYSILSSIIFMYKVSRFRLLLWLNF